MKEFISSGPSAQFNPTISGFACAMEVRNASSVCPLSVRPERSVIVPETMSGTSFFSNASAIANNAALALRVSKTVASSNNIYLARCIAQANIMNDALEKFRIFTAIVWFAGKQKFVQADRGRAESIRLNYIGAGAEIFFVHALDRLRFRQQQKFGRAFEVLAFPIAKTFA